MIKIIAYKGHSLTSKAIKLLTRSEYSHVAFMLDDGSVVEAWDNHGLRKVSSISEQHSPNTEVDVFIMSKLTAYQEHQLKQILEVDLLDPAKYDWKMVFKFVPIVRLLTKNNEVNPDKFFCSEYVTERLLNVGFNLFNSNTKPYEVPPDWIPRSLAVSYVETLTTK